MNTPRSTVPSDTRSRRRKAPWLGALFAATLTVAMIAAPSAMADMIGPYNIDGVVPDATTPALTPIPDAAGNTKELGPLNASTTKIGVIHKDAVPTLGETNPNAQVDLNTAWLATDRVGGDDFLYFAWQRDKEVGSGFIAYEFMKNAAPIACAYGTASAATLIANCNPWANRAAGDFLILWDQQGGSTDLIVRRWQGTAPNLTLSAAVPLSNYDAQYSADGFRGEAAINLTANGLGSGGACLAFANVIPSTVTGNSDTADYKDTILQRITLSNCTSTTVTTPQDGDGVAIPGSISIGDGEVEVQDSAEISVTGGNATPAGSVAFWLCKVDTGTCDGTAGRVGTSVGSTNVTGAAYPVTVSSPSAFVSATGRYCWRATFTGDEANSIPGSSDFSTGECFEVDPVDPELSTEAGPNVYLGASVTDTAELSGTATQPRDPVINLTAGSGAPAGGTITFKLYGPSDDGCGALFGTTSAVNVSGDGSYDSPALTPTATGNYHWVAVYSGSPNTNGVTHNADCADEAEDVEVQSVASSISTDQEWVPNDSATVSAPAGGALDGTVTFSLFASADCSGTAIYTVDRVVAGASPQTVETANTTAVTASGDYSWQVSYDSENAAQRDIGASCEETSVLTIDNGEEVSSD
ncbi:hemagglutinin [Microbacterium sp. HJ5]